LLLFSKKTNPNQSKEVNGTVILPPLVFPVIGGFNVIRKGYPIRTLRIPAKSSIVKVILLFVVTARGRKRKREGGRKGTRGRK
jgi:hypothetical protein